MGAFSNIHKMIYLTYSFNHISILLAKCVATTKGPIEQSDKFGTEKNSETKKYMYYRQMLIKNECQVTLLFDSSNIDAIVSASFGKTIRCPYLGAAAT